jgi:cobalamin biosynthesis Mg chelatase CobN
MGCTWSSNTFTSEDTTTTTTTSEIITTTTTTTTSSSTTTTSSSTTTTSATTSSTSTTTTTTTPSGGNFTASGFSCGARTGGYNCTITYDNELGENAVIVFGVSDSSGNPIYDIPYTVPTGSATATNINYFCINGGTYYMSYEVYRLSDTDLEHAVAFSSPSQRQLIAC